MEIHGVLYPSGHRAQYSEITERMGAEPGTGATAKLRKRTVLTVTEPTRDEPDDPALARAFPFARTEIATLEFAGVDDPNDPDLHPAGTRGLDEVPPDAAPVRGACQAEGSSRTDGTPGPRSSTSSAVRPSTKPWRTPGTPRSPRTLGIFSSSSSRSTWSRTRSRPPRTTRRPCRGSSGRCATGSRSSSPSVARARPAASSSACRCSSSPTRISSRPRRCPRSTRCTTMAPSTASRTGSRKPSPPRRRVS